MYTRVVTRTTLLLRNEQQGNKQQGSKQQGSKQQGQPQRDCLYRTTHTLKHMHTQLSCVVLAVGASVACSPCKWGHVPQDAQATILLPEVSPAVSAAACRVPTEQLLIMCVRRR
jgi:hypothetical protein